MAVIPHLVVQGAKKAVEFYTAAFVATAERVMPAEDGQRLMHAELHLFGGKFFLCDDFPEYCGGVSKVPGESTPVTIHLEVPDCDAAIAQAATAGATVTMPATDMFWGDRYGQVKDPFGHQWSFSHPLAKA